jgi:hypothetical protein
MLNIKIFIILSISTALLIELKRKKSPKIAILKGLLSIKII